MAQLKRKQVRVYLDEAAQEKFDRLVSEIGSLSESSVMTALLTAALDACADNGYRMPLPLRFRINELDRGLNDPKTTKYGVRRPP
jgi:hypothetical protein